MQNKIIVHEDWQEVSYRTMHLALWFARQGGPPPEAVQGQVLAVINYGRWIVDCPADGCRGAVVASLVTREFFCTECGSRENYGKVYRVVFPRFRAALEKELIKRPSRVPFSAEHRNWTPSESLAAIKAENIAHGVA